MRNLIVFDFDGTIADVEDLMLDIYSIVAEKNGWPKLTKGKIATLKSGGAREAMRMLGVKFWQLPKLLNIGRTEYKKRSSEVKLFPNAITVLDKLAEQNDLYILSSNDQKTVKKILKNNNVNTKIEVLHGSPLFGKDKVLKRLIKIKKYKASSAWMIGDEIRDIEAGKKSKMKTIGVAWGLQGEIGLKKVNADYMAYNFNEVLEIINS